MPFPFSLTGTKAQASLTATEQVELDLAGQIVVDDPDSGASNITVTLAADYGVINAAAGDSGVTVAGSGSGLELPARLH